MRASDEKLAKHLREDKAPQWMIDRAETSYYNDYFGVPTNNIAALIDDAVKLGLQRIVHIAIHGGYDGTIEEAKEWEESQEGKESARDLETDPEFQSMFENFKNLIGDPEKVAAAKKQVGKLEEDLKRKMRRQSN